MSQDEDVELKSTVIQEQYEDDGFEQSGDDLSSMRYGQIKDKDMFIDVTKDKLVDKKDLTPFAQIKLAAEQSGTILRKPNSGCKKCYGRGYTGTTITGEPVACTCLFPARTGQQLKAQEMQFNYMQAVIKKNMQMKNNIVGKTAKMLEKEFNKRLEQNPIDITATEEVQNVATI